MLEKKMTGRFNVYLLLDFSKTIINKETVERDAYLLVIFQAYLERKLSDPWR